ncbi:MAG TPA: hypothetical protein VF288_10525 [Mycobacteriales bacterium]
MRRHGWAYRVIDGLENDHRKQINFHRWAIVFWLANVPAAVVIMLLWPGLWATIGILYVLLLSLYANADTDFDAMSAAQGALHAQAIDERTRVRPTPVGHGPRLGASGRKDDPCS